MSCSKARPFYLSLLVMALPIWSFGQTSSLSNVNLGIRVVSAPTEVKINGMFEVTTEVYLEGNSSDIPEGESVYAIIELIDPDGITIGTESNEWDGFSNLSNGQIDGVFQITWSQADKYTPDRKWQIVARVSASSAETDLSQNQVSQELSLILPDLTVDIDTVTATNPITGEQTTDFVPNTNYRVRGKVSNVGGTMTQPGVYFHLVAHLIKLNEIDEGLYDRGYTLDEEIILLPSTQVHAGLQPDESWEFEIDELFMPADANGQYAIQVVVNYSPFQTMREVSFLNNYDIHPGTPSDTDNDGNADSWSSPFIEIGTGGDEQGQAELRFVENSYKGETGSFHGLEPVFISFAIRNSGSGPVKASDRITARILLSEDVEFDKSDFILREFNLGGDGIGLDMLAGETLNLTWFQQVPDNFEGDYYILVQLINEQFPLDSSKRNSIQSLDNTPILTLTTEDAGQTNMISTVSAAEFALMEALLGEASGINEEINRLYAGLAQLPVEVRGGVLQIIGQKEESLSEIAAQISALKSPTERASVSENGRFVAFEKRAPIKNANDLSSINGAFQQIFLIDTFQPNPTPKLISRTYTSTNSLGDPANGDSYRPQISDDGDAIVFHSRADNLVPGDSNDKEDVFLYRISTNTMLRAVNSKNEQLNGKSIYPDINEDGTMVVFSSDATNAVDGLAGEKPGRQVYLWSLSKRGTGSIQLVSQNTDGDPGDGSSQNPSIDKSGNRIVFDSHATNLVAGDTNGLSDIFLFEKSENPESSPHTLQRINLNYDFKETNSSRLGLGHSLNPKISGNGLRAVFESSATNLIPQAGIASIVVDDGGAGYYGSPSIEIYDAGLNDQAYMGRGAILKFKEDGINALSQIKSDAIEILLPGEGYVDPVVRIIPDPAYPEPTLEAQVSAFLSSPQGDVYFVDIPVDLDNPQAEDLNYSIRISESENGVGGNFGSRDLSISLNGDSVVYASKSSNLLSSEITRRDGKKFYNDRFDLPTAKAVLVGGIGEIEIRNYGSGYSSGYLKIDDLSGSGSGAVASFQVDNFGRIIDVTVIEAGQNYNLETTIVSVKTPLGGTGFEAGEVRFVPTKGEGKDRTGGGRIFKIEMTNNGYGFRIGDDPQSSFGELFNFEGDGADLDEDGFPDGRLNPNTLIRLPDNDRLYLSQSFVVEIANLQALPGTVLKISDKNTTLEPLEIRFADTINSALILSTNGKSKTEVRDELVDLILSQLSSPGNDDLHKGVIVDEQHGGGSSFKITSLSGKFETSNQLGVKVTPISNMLIMGSGYTKATPVLNQVPVIYGFSEVSTSNMSLESGKGRATSISEPDTETDDIYLCNISKNGSAVSIINERISVSTFGTPVRYLNNLENSTDSVPSLPSNRFPVISGNGRYVFFSSDSSGREGLAFDASNQYPLDSNPSRDLYFRDLKTFATFEETASVEILFPNDDLANSFAPQTPIPVIAQVEYSGKIERVDMILNQRLVGTMVEFGAGKELDSRRFTAQIQDVNGEDLRGDYTLQLVAYSEGELSVAASSLIRFSVDPFVGSLPPAVSLTTPDFDSITSQSTIPLSADGNDPDGTMVGIQFYLDGKKYGDEILRTEGIAEEEQRYPILLDLNDSGDLVENNGVRSVFVIGRDNSGSHTASSIYNFSFTSGASQPPEISLNGASSDYKLSKTLGNLDINVTSGSITGIEMLTSPLGENIFAARVDVSGKGSGAEILPVIEDNASSDNFGMITALELVSGGIGWEENSTILSIVPIIRAINVGVPAEVEFFIVPPGDENQTDLDGFVRFKKNVDGSSKVGSGYAISPRLEFFPNYKFSNVPELLPLAPPQGSTSSVSDFGSIDVKMNINEPVLSASVVGGFAQSPLYFSVEANSSGEKIKSVQLVVNGQTLDNVKTEPPFSFSFAPNAGIGDYIVSAIVEDHSGNIISTKSSIYNVTNYQNSGISLNFLGETDISIEADGTLMLFAEATSAAGVAGVEFFIDDVWVGDGNRSSESATYYTAVELSALNLQQGEHQISVIARDILGNQAGTFRRSQTNVPSRQNKKLSILPPAAREKDSLYIQFVYPPDMLDDLNASLYEGSNYMAVVDVVDRFGRIKGLRMMANGTVVDEIDLSDENRSAEENANNLRQTNALIYDRHYLNWQNITPGGYSITFDAIGSSGGIIPLPVFEENENGELIKAASLDYKINVKQVNMKKLPPFVEITFPLNNFTVTSDSRIVIAATGSDTDGIIEKMAFLENGNLITVNQIEAAAQGPQSSSIIWQPPRKGVFSISVAAYDNNDEISISAPVTILVTENKSSQQPVVNSEEIELFLPDSDPDVDDYIIRTSTKEVRDAKAHITSVVGMAPELDMLGAIVGYEITDFGTGYVRPPEVRFYGSGTGAKAVALIDTDPFSPLYGSVIGVDFIERGSAYEAYYAGYSTSIASRMAFIGGHDIMSVPLKVELPMDADNYREVYILVNGEIVDLNNDDISDEKDKFLNPPFETSKQFSTGEFELHVVTRDKFNNIDVSLAKKVTVAATKGVPPSAQITYPELSGSENPNIELNELYESIGTSSRFPIYISAFDEDGTGVDVADLPEVNLYANQMLIGRASRRQGSLQWYVDLNGISVTPGKYNFNVGAVDEEGNYYRSSGIPLEIVSTMQVPPEIQMISPISSLDQYTIGSTISFSVQVRERTRPIQSVEFIVDGVVIDKKTIPEISIGDMHIYTGSFSPSNMNSFMLSAVVTDLSGIKAVTDYNASDYGAFAVEELITHLPSIEKVVGGLPLNGKIYDLVRYVGNKRATEESFFATSSGFGINAPPRGSLELPASGLTARAHQEINLLANASDIDGSEQDLSCQFLANGGNVLLQFKQSPTAGDSITFTPVGQAEPALECVFGPGKIEIASSLEQTAKNLYEYIQYQQAIQPIDGLYKCFFPENFYSNERDDLYRTIFLRTDSNAIEIQSSAPESVYVNPLPTLPSTETGSFVGSWIPHLGGIYVIHGVVEDRWGGKMMTNHSVIIVEHSDQLPVRTVDSDFNGSLEIFPTMAMYGEPLARGSSLSARATFFDNDGLEKSLRQVKFLLNGKTVSDFSGDPPFYADFKLEGTDPSWLLQVIGYPDYNNSTDEPGVIYEMEAIVLERSGPISTAVELPEVSLSLPNGIKSSDGIKSFYENSQITIEAKLTGIDEVLRKVSSINFIINGEPMTGAIRQNSQFTPGGLLESITYSSTITLDSKFGTFISSFPVVQSLAEVSAIAVLTDPAATAKSKNPESIIIIGGSQNPASILEDLTGQSVSVGLVNSLSSGSENFHEWIADQSNLIEFSNKIDIVGAYNISLGNYHNSFNDFVADYDEFVLNGDVAGSTITRQVTPAELSSLPPEVANTAFTNPVTGLISVTYDNSFPWLKRYIDFVLTGNDYMSKFPEVPDLVGSYGNRLIENYAKNRENFVKQCLINKYGSATFFQANQGSLRLLNFWKSKMPNYWEISSGGSANDTGTGGRMDDVPIPGIESGELALELISRLVKEEKYFGREPYILGTRAKRDKEYLVMAYIFSFWKEGGSYPMTDESLSDYSGLSKIEIIELILSHPNYTNRYNYLFTDRNARRLANSIGWKEVPWLGYISDLSFPWIYHSDLGWLYATGTSHKSFWVYKEGLGWLWFSNKAYPHTFSASQDNWIYFDVNSKTNRRNRSKARDGVYYYSYKFGKWSKL